MPNRLWVARKRAGYLQKWVAVLLGARSLSVVSEYERGRKLPSFRAAVRLELIYRTPLADLFPGLYASLAREIEDKRQDSAPIRQRDLEISEERARRLTLPLPRRQG